MLLDIYSLMSSCMRFTLYARDICKPYNFMLISRTLTCPLILVRPKNSLHVFRRLPAKALLPIVN